MHYVILTTRGKINGLEIKERENRGIETWIPKYTVFSPDGILLEEFRRFDSAVRWCQRTKDFVSETS